MKDAAQQRDEELVAKLAAREFLNWAELDEIAALISGIPERIRKAVKADRVSLFQEVAPCFSVVAKALQDLPFKVAESPIRQCQAIVNVILDPVGEHAGECDFCEEPVFITALDDPDHDCELQPEGGWAHRSCVDRLRETNPELFSHDEADLDE